jgi:uncharacterized protein YbjQ (UPF0145 family)
LPVKAEARMAEIRRSGTWSSALTADEFAAVRSVGFEPMGQVLGAAVYNIGYTGGYNCPGPFGDGMVSPDRSVTQVSGRGGSGWFGPLAQTLYKARRTVIARMSAECARLGGHGVVGVRLTVGAFPTGGLEFRAIGTAVRAAGARRLRRPFTCDLSGQDFTKLISKGWVPAGLVLGISVGVRHDDRLTRGQTWWSAGNAEVLGYTELVNDVRRDARSQLHLDVQRLGAEGVVIADVSLQIRERACPVREVAQRDHIAEATIIGTAIARFSRAARQQGASSLSILSLDPQRRQEARIGDSVTREEASRAVPFAPTSPDVPWPVRLRAITRPKR